MCLDEDEDQLSYLENDILFILVDPVLEAK